MNHTIRTQGARRRHREARSRQNQVFTTVRVIRNILDTHIRRFPKNSSGLSEMANLAWAIHGGTANPKMTRGIDDEGNYFLHITGISHSELSNAEMKLGHHEGRDSKWSGPSEVGETSEIDRTYPRYKNVAVDRDKANEFERGLNKMKIDYRGDSGIIGGYQFFAVCNSLEDIQRIRDLRDSMVKPAPVFAPLPDVPSVIPGRPGRGGWFKSW